jgi:hypothetical protein
MHRLKTLVVAVAVFLGVTFASSRDAYACSNPALARTLPMCNFVIAVQGLRAWYAANLSPPGSRESIQGWYSYYSWYYYYYYYLTGNAEYYKWAKYYSDAYYGYGSGDYRGYYDYYGYGDYYGYYGSYYNYYSSYYSQQTPHAADALLGRDGQQLREQATGSLGSYTGLTTSPSWTNLTGLTTPLTGFTGGVNVAVGDLTNDGVADVIVSPGAGGGPRVTVFDGRTGTPANTSSFFAFDNSFRGGVFVSAGDLDGDGVADVVTGAGPEGGPRVNVISGTGGGPSVFPVGDDRAGVIRDFFGQTVSLDPNANPLFPNPNTPPDPTSPFSAGLFGSDASPFGGGPVIADGPGGPGASGASNPPPSGTGTTPPAGGASQTGAATATPAAPPLVTGVLKNADGEQVKIFVDVGGGKYKALKIVRQADGKTIAVSGSDMPYGEVRQDANGQWQFPAGGPTPPGPDAQPLRVPEGQPVNAPQQAAGAGQAQGGAVAPGGGAPTIRNSTISGNQASPPGGGVSAGGPAPTIRNSTVSGNQASPQGGGVSNTGPAPTIQNSTISGNQISRDVEYRGFPGSTGDLPNLFGPGNQARLSDSTAAGPVPGAANVILIDPSTGQPITSQTGRDVCNPCTFLPNASGGAPVVDMPLIIQTAGGPPSSQNFIAIVVPANINGVAVADQAANTVPKVEITDPRLFRIGARIQPR